MNEDFSMNLEAEIANFADKRAWEVVRGARGSTGSYWIKDGRFRMVSIEPKSYGWLIGISNMLFVNLERPETCMLKRPSGEHRFDVHKRTKNFWKVTTQKDLLDFLNQ